MAELLAQRWTLIVASVWLVVIAAVGGKRIWLAYPGIAFAWGLGLLHNLGIRVDAGHG